LNVARTLGGDPAEVSAGQAAQLLARWEQESSAADRTVELEAARHALAAARGEFARAEARLAAAQHAAQAGPVSRQEVRLRYEQADRSAPAGVDRPVPPEPQVEAARGEAFAAADGLGEATRDLEAARVRVQEAEAAEHEARHGHEAARGRKSLLEEQLRATQATVQAYAGTLAALGLATSADDGPVAELEETNRRIGRLEQAAERACWLTEAARVTTLREAVAQAEAQEAEARAQVKSATEEANRWARATAGANRAAAALGTARTREQDQRLTCYEPAVNEIYRRINPHPYFPHIRLEPTPQTSQLTIHATTAENQVRLPVQQYFSMAQANVVALSIFLGTALLQTWSGLRLICIDDPIQQMDDLNTVAFLDVLHAIVQRQRQVVVTTANKEFYQLMLRRYAYLNQHQTRFRAFRLRTVNLETGPDMAEDSPRFLSDTLVRLGPN
jgi:hypothetical protein